MKKAALTAAMLAVLSIPANAGYSELNVAIDYFNQDAWGNAVIWFDKAIEAGDLNPDQMHVAYIDRGLAHSELHEFSKAISDYTAALALKPNDRLIMRERAAAYKAIGQPDNAILDLSVASMGAPNTLATDFQAGLVDWRQGHYEDARAVFARLTGRATTAWFWLQLSSVKSGAPVSPPSDQEINSRQWPDPLKAFYAGKIDEEALLKKVQAATEVCDANFYIGEWRLAHDDASAAKPLLQKAAGICANTSYEKTMALFEIEKLSGVKQ